jgi:uncharacterized repeat protein (TIGR03803 family)
MIRKLLFLFLILNCVQLTYAQVPTLFGTTYGGGKYGNGTVFTYNLSTSKESVVINFDTLNGIGPLGNLVPDTVNKLLYGTTNSGGDSNRGVLFSYNYITSKDSTLDIFHGTNGKSPGQGSLTPFGGNLYGMTNGGGKYGHGILFMYNPITGKDSTIVNFDTGSGKEYGPLGTNLALYPGNGLLYGMTYSGGKNGIGTIFSFNPSTGKDSVTVSMNTLNGAQPQEGTLTLNPANGLFYGLTGAGGTYNNGVLFSYNPVTGKDTALVQFNVLNGTSPYGGLLLDTLNGLLYGMTNAGGLDDFGVLFSFNPVSGKQTILFNFNDTLGSSPTGNLILGLGGKLYGTTNSDQNGNGLIFSYDPVTKKYKVVFTFNFIDGSGPYGSLTLVNMPAVTAIENASSTLASILIYPNPGNGKFIIESSVISGQLSVEVYNVLGEKIANSHRLIANSKMEIDLNNQPSGIYFLRIYDDKQHYISTQKVVVQ